MHPVDALARLGGVARLSDLVRLTTRDRVRGACRNGLVVKVGRGRYALPTASAGLKAAASLSGHASHRSAAAAHGWEIGTQPEQPEVVVPRNRKVEPHRRHGVDLRWRDLDPHEKDGLVTSKHRTVIDCAKDLPFTEALAVADSALRHGDVDLDELARLAHRLPSTGRAQGLRVVEHASPLADNPFESMLRALALDVPGLEVRPQVWIEELGFRGRPDLVDVTRRIVIEAESFEFHGKRRALKHDCERYTGLTVRGWTVVRFAWEHVMFEQDYVRQALLALVGHPDGRAALTRSLLWTA